MNETTNGEIFVAHSENETEEFDDWKYSCGGNKLCVIFDMHIYAEVENCRYGTEIDRYRLYRLFENMGFSIMLICNSNDIQKNILEVKNKCIKEKIQLLITIVLCHGREENTIVSVNGNAWNIFSDFIGKFTTDGGAVGEAVGKANEEADGEAEEEGVEPPKTFLKGIPKFFIFQSCRGKNVTSGRRAQSEYYYTSNKRKYLPTDVDTLIAYSTLPGCEAGRDEEKGSPYILLLCLVFQALYLKYDVVTMLTIVNKLVAEKVQSVIETISPNGKLKVPTKIMSSFRSYLTKELFLSDKTSKVFQPLPSLVKKFCPEDDYFYSLCSLSYEHFFSGPATYGILERQRKVCVIFNQTTLRNNGEEFANMQKMFADMKFLVDPQENSTHEEIRNYIALERDPKHCLAKKTDIMCLVVIILTKGNDNKLLVKGGEMTLNNLICPFVQCPDLLGCPKFFIIQAWQEGKKETYTDEYIAGKDVKHKFISFCEPDSLRPPDADVLVMYSADIGFTEVLQEVFNKEYKQRDIVSMLTQVNYAMSRKETNTLDAATGKMSCWFVSRLTGLFYLTDQPPPSPPRLSYQDLTSIPKVEDKFNPGDGLCIVFDQTEFLCEKQNDDCDRLKMIFTSYRFKVLTYKNQTKHAIKDILNQVKSHSDSKNITCLVVFVLSHGIQNNQLWASDDFYSIDDLISPFTKDNCEELIGKPKCFFIQACRGELLPTKIVEEQIVKIEEDMLITYGITPGFCSNFEKIAGSIFIRKICNSLEHEYLEAFYKEKSDYEIADVEIELLVKLKNELENKNCFCYSTSKLKYKLTWCKEFCGYDKNYPTQKDNDSKTDMTDIMSRTSNDETDSNETTAHDELPIFNKEKSQKSKEDVIIEKTLGIVESVAKRNQQENELEIFGKFIVTELRQITCPMALRNAKIEIQKVLFQTPMNPSVYQPVPSTSVLLPSSCNVL